MDQRSQRKEILTVICERVANGEALRRMCEDTEGYPAYSTVLRWLEEDADLSVLYARARQLRGDYRADRISEIAEECLRGDVDPQAARVAIDSLKWLASKEGPRKYGDKLEIESKTDNTFTIQILDYTSGKPSKTITIAEPQKQIEGISPV